MSNTIVLTPYDRILRGKIWLMKRFPFFSYLVQHLKIKETPEVSTCAVDAFSNLYYNPDFISKFSDEKIAGVLCHEVLHLALTHPKRGKQIDDVFLISPDGNVTSLFNIACDIVVNNVLVLNGIELPEGGIIPQNNSVTIFDTTIQNISEKSAEEIFFELLNHIKKKFPYVEVENPTQQNRRQPQQQQQNKQSSCSNCSTSKNVQQGGQRQNSSSSGQGTGQNKQQQQVQQTQQSQQGQQGNYGQQSQPNQQGRSGQQGNNDTGKEKIKGFKVNDTIKTFDEHRFDDQSNNLNNQNNQGDNQNNQDQISQGLNEQSGWPEQIAENEIDWSQVMANALTHARMRGHIPLGINCEYEILNKPPVNWRFLLQEAITDAVPTDFTWRRPNKKGLWNEMILPSMERESLNVIVAIDTSGSMSKQELSEAMTELLNICSQFQNYTIRLLTHDTEVHSDYEITPDNIDEILEKQIELKGGGGTSHIPLFEYIDDILQENYSNRVLIISFTDGYSEFPEESPSYPVIFVLPSSVNSDMINRLPAWSFRKLKIMESGISDLTPAQSDYDYSMTAPGF